MNVLSSFLAGAILLGVAGIAYFFAGAYDVGADVPHTKPVFWLIEKVRERSIAARTANVVVPPLDFPALVTSGARHYATMCAGCHLAPGMKDSEFRAGLYPQPPDLSLRVRPPRESFWIIKHGLKMTAMPAWGGAHDDAAIWSLVAFLQDLPRLSPEEYRRLATNAIASGHHGGDVHGHDLGNSAVYE
jgi:mono/diheme cytochrome c family protein